MIVYIPVWDKGRWSVLKADTEKTITGMKQFKRWGTTDHIVYCGMIYSRAFRSEEEAWNYIRGEYAVPLTLEELEEFLK